MLPQPRRRGRPDARFQGKRDGHDGCGREVSPFARGKEKCQDRQSGNKRGRESRRIKDVESSLYPAGAKTPAHKRECEHAGGHWRQRDQVAVDLGDKVLFGIVVRDITAVLVQVEIAAGDETRRDE